MKRRANLLLLIVVLSLAFAACSRDDAAATDEREARSEAHDDERTREGAIALTTGQIKAAGIDLAEAGPARIRETLQLYGVIAPNAERLREVAARYPGIIRTVARKIGDAVRAGEALATVESNESLQTYPVVAPLAGVVTARNANPGEQTGDKALFTVADLSTVWVEVSLFPRDMRHVRVGQEARVHSAETGHSADGKVVYVAPFGSAASQTLTARVLLDNAERRWAPGLYVTAEVTLVEAPVAVAVRNEAVQTVEGRSVAFVRSGAGFEPRSLRLGRSDAEHTEVLEGLAAGETYVTRNSFVLKAELGKNEAEHEH